MARLAYRRVGVWRFCVILFSIGEGVVVAVSVGIGTGVDAGICSVACVGVVVGVPILSYRRWGVWRFWVILFCIGVGVVLSLVSVMVLRCVGVGVVGSMFVLMVAALRALMWQVPGVYFLHVFPNKTSF